MKTIDKRTKGDYSLYGELDNLTIEAIQNKDTDEEYYERIATVTGYDNHKCDYDKWEANADFIVKACNNYDALVNTLSRLKDAAMSNSEYECDTNLQCAAESAETLLNQLKETE